MFGIERQEEIKEILKREKTISVGELSKKFAVSEATIRRDLKTLAEKNVIQRIYGGAFQLEKARFELPLSEKEAQQKEEKTLIAQKAAEMILAGDTIAMDGGTTTLAVAQQISNIDNLTLVTNSLKIAVELATNKNINLIMTGGSLRGLNLTFVGPLSKDILDKLHIDKLFTGTVGFTIEEGLSTTDVSEAETKRYLIQRAKEVILIADHTKLGKLAFVNVAPLKSVDKLVTDKGMPEKEIRKLEKLGLEVILA